MTIVHVIQIVAVTFFFGFCVALRAFRSTGRSLGQVLSLPMGGILLAYSGFGYLNASELAPAEASRDRVFYLVTACLVIIAFVILWRRKED